VEQTVTDDEIQQHVEDALDWADPSVDGSRIGVTVDKGVVTIRGTVDTPPEKLTAERVAQRVRGVETVINQLAASSIAQTEATHSERAGGRQGERDPSCAAGP
jgi:osmotically-inducible protein OsmY